MRIGIFTQCYHPTNNGVVVSIDTFKKELEKRGHEVFTIAPYNRHLEEKEASNIIRLPSLSVHKDYPPAILALAGKQKKEITSLKLDVIHSQHPFLIGNFAIKMARKSNIPVVYTYHTLIENYVHYFPGPEKFKKNIVVSISKKFCNRVDQVITPSNPMKDILLSYGVTKPIEVIPTGIDFSEFQNPYSKAELHKDWQIPAEKKILLYVARIAKEKNIDFLFSATKVLREKRNDFQLLMVGGGPQLNNYKALAKKLGINDCTTFTDMQPKPGVNRFFGAGDIFVFSSVTETQGIVVSEAMAAGVPAVAVDKMGPSDIIQNGVDGYLTPLNLSKFTYKINYLLDNENERLKMGIQAKKNVQKFSASACAIHMEDIYEKTIDSYNAKSNNL